MFPTARSLDALAVGGGITAAHYAGGTGNGHHWQLYAQDGAALARTVRVHNGGKVAQMYWKFVTLTGLDINNDIHVELTGADGCVLARASSSYSKQTVGVSDSSGQQVARSERVKHTLTLYGADDSPVAALTCEGDGPWAVRSPAGDVLGELLAGDPGPSLSPSLWLWAADTQWALSAATYSRAMHLGLRRVKRYSFAPTGNMPPALALLPLLCGLTY